MTKKRLDRDKKWGFQGFPYEWITRIFTVLSA